MGCGITDPVGCVTGVVGGIAKSAASDVFDAIAKEFSEAAAAACTWLWGQIDSATAIDLSGQGIKTDLLATGSIAVVICLGLFVIQVLACALRQDMSGLGRAARGLPIAFIGAAVGIGSTAILLSAVDSLSDGVVQFALGTNVQGMGSKLVDVTTLTAIGNPAGQLLLALVVLMSVVVIWVAMMIRKMLIIISAVFAPIAFAGAVSDISKGWVKKWVEFTAALVFSKLILVIIFMIGLSVLNGAGTANNASSTAQVTSLACGALTLLLAGLAPWMAIKLVHFAGDSFHAVHAQAGAATAGATAAAAAPQKLSLVSSRLGMGGAGMASSSGSATVNGQPKSGPWTPGGAASPPTGGAGAAGGAAGGSVAAAGPAAPIAAGGVAVAQGVKSTAAKVGEHGTLAGPSAPSGQPTPPPGPSSST